LRIRGQVSHRLPFVYALGRGQKLHLPIGKGLAHVFLGEQHQRNERRTSLMIAITATMMVVEIAAGTMFGSMALVADGWHMSISLLAIVADVQA